MMKNSGLKSHILITGSSGFVGSNLYNYLKNDFEIESKSVRFIPNQNFVIKGEGIIHLAGKAHDLKKVSKPNEYIEANFELTKQLFDSFLVSDAQVFIFMSTVKAAADIVDGVLTEQVTADPRTHYGISKLRAEKYILTKELPIGKRVYILRPCMIHGPGNKGNLNMLYNFVAKGFPWPLGAFKNQRSFLSIENLCFVVDELLKNQGIPSGIYQIADDKTFSTNDLIRILAKSLNKNAVIWCIPVDMIRVVFKFGDFLHLSFNSERLQKLTENYKVSNEKIVKAIGKPLPVSSSDGLLRTFQSFRKKI